MHVFTTKIYGMPKTANQRAQEWVNQNAVGPVSVRISPNYGAAVSTISVKILTPKEDANAQARAIWIAAKQERD